MKDADAILEKPRRIARIAGFLYLLEMITGAIAIYALGTIVVAGDAAATAANNSARWTTTVICSDVNQSGRILR